MYLMVFFRRTTRVIPASVLRCGAVQVSLPTGTHSAGGVVPAGALSSYTGRLMSSRSFKSVRDVAKAFNKLLPSNIQNVNAKIDEYARGGWVGGWGGGSAHDGWMRVERDGEEGTRCFVFSSHGSFGWVVSC